MVRVTYIMSYKMCITSSCCLSLEDAGSHSNTFWPILQLVLFQRCPVIGLPSAPFAQVKAVFQGLWRMVTESFSMEPTLTLALGG